MATEITTTSKILALHAEGLSVGDIARKLDISYQHAYNVLQSKKVEMPVRSRVGTLTEKIVKLHDEGMSTGDIARSLDITFQHAYNTLRNKKKISAKK
jgi:orotate phosphoribosyltransferase-like protein